MAMERTVPARLKAGLLGRMAVAIRALNAAWISGEANGAVQSLAPRSPAQGVGAKRELAQRIKDASVPETAEIAQVVNPFLGEMRQIAGNLAAHAGLAGEASVQLAAMSRRTPFSASGWQHPSAVWRARGTCDYCARPAQRIRLCRGRGPIARSQH